MFTAARVTLMVKDVDRSTKFDAEILGLRPTVQCGNEWVEFEAPELQRFFEHTCRLAQERRLSRFTILAERPRRGGRS